MNKNLKLGYDTSLLIEPAKKSAPTKFGGGAKQAPVIPPVAITVLESGLPFAAHCMIFGVVRVAHIQRSVVHSVDDVAIYMWCYRGKQTHTGLGFTGVCPGSAWMGWTFGSTFGSSWPDLLQPESRRVSLLRVCASTSTP